MKAYIIQSGHFSQAGNFMGFSAKGEKIHIYKKHILELFPKVGIVYRCLERYEKELVTLPFYCLAEDDTFDYLNCNGQKTGHKFTRLTAFVISDKEYQIKTAAVQHWADSKIKDLLDDIHNLKIDNETSYNKMAEQCNNLRDENEDLIDENKKLKWDLEYSQSERERLQLLCDELWQYRKASDALKSMTSDQLNQLINNV
jgi:hypothetical protein